MRNTVNCKASRNELWLFDISFNFVPWYINKWDSSGKKEIVLTDTLWISTPNIYIHIHKTFLQCDFSGDFMQGKGSFFKIKYYNRTNLVWLNLISFGFFFPCHQHFIGQRAKAAACRGLSPMAEWCQTCTCPFKTFQTMFTLLDRPSHFSWQFTLLSDCLPS